MASRHRQPTALSGARLTALQQGLVTERAAPPNRPTGEPPAPEPLSSEPFPSTRLMNPSHDVEHDIRLPRTMKLRAHQALLASAQNELAAKGQAARSDLQQEVQHYLAEVAQLEAGMSKDFIYQHTQLQLISPQNFFTGKLFDIKNRNAPRDPHVEFPLDVKAQQGARYLGPELRQDDALVFMALLNLCRDYRVGKQAAFDVAAMSIALWGSYNGQKRSRLKETVRRLQRATIALEDFTVQLVLRFEHPKRGEWSVALDPDIVNLFRDQRVTRLDLPMRRRLSEGLTTWLYGYIRSQSFLIPWRIDDLRQRCGSDATAKTFRDMLLNSLAQLAEEGLIDDGWFLRGDFVHWRMLTAPPAKRTSVRRKPKQVRAAEQLSLGLEAGDA